MGIFEHTTHWVEGELFESLLVVAFGVFLLLLGWAFGKLGETEGARAMFLPILLVGALFAVAGAGNYVSNRIRRPQLEEAHRADPSMFVSSEKERVEKFQILYTITLILAPLLFAAASIIFWRTMDPKWRAAGVALVVLGLSGLVIDFFSKERADIYYGKIQAALEAAAR